MSYKRKGKVLKMALKCPKRAKRRRRKANSFNLIEFTMILIISALQMFKLLFCSDWY